MNPHKTKDTQHPHPALEIIFSTEEALCDVRGSHVDADIMQDNLQSMTDAFGVSSTASSSTTFINAHRGNISDRA